MRPCRTLMGFWHSEQGFSTLIPTALHMREKWQVNRDVPQRGPSRTLSEAIGETQIFRAA